MTSRCGGDNNNDDDDDGAMMGISDDGPVAVVKLLSRRCERSLFLILGYTRSHAQKFFHIFSGSDLSNGKLLTINSQAG